MKILLVNPPCGPRTIGMRFISRIEPLGLETIGAAVSREHDVRLVDMLTRPADLLRTLKVFRPAVVGVTTEAVRFGQAMDVLRTIRVGLSIAMIGLEALDQDALRRFHKGTKTSQNEQAVRLLEELGITISGGFLVEPTATPDDFDRMDHYVKTHPSIVHAEFTPLTPFPGTKYFEQQKHTVLTRDWEVFDMQHFVQKTTLPVKELYRMMVRSYRKIVLRQMFREHLWMPIVGLRQRKWRVLRGLLANGRALSHAHLHVPEVAEATACEPKKAHAA